MRVSQMTILYELKARASTFLLNSISSSLYVLPAVSGTR